MSSRNPIVRSDSCAGYVAVDLSGGDVSFPPGLIRAVYLGTAGDFVVVGANGTDAPCLIKNLVAGVWHPMQITKIVALGTTAANIVVGS